MTSPFCRTQEDHNIRKENVNTRAAADLSNNSVYAFLLSLFLTAGVPTGSPGRRAAGGKSFVEGFVLFILHFEM